MATSAFQRSGGYYSAMLDGYEISRWAGSPHWTDFVKWAESYYGDSFSFSYVPGDPEPETEPEDIRDADFER